MSTVDRVREIVEPLLARHSLELYDVEHSGSQLRVLIDRPAGSDLGPLDLDLIADITRLVSLALDEHDPMPGRYTLEVSSPGLERPLRTADHYRRAVGETITLKLLPGADERRVRGTLADADDLGITVDGRHIPYDLIDKARTVFEWGPAPKPAAKPKPKPAKQKAKKVS